MATTQVSISSSINSTTLARTTVVLELRVIKAAATMSAAVLVVSAVSVAENTVGSVRVLMLPREGC
jgi:hypothetical protein